MQSNQATMDEMPAGVPGVPPQSARIPDLNGWYEIKRNPISKVGVYPYSGKQIGDEKADPGKIYMVYRPAEELADPDCMASFRLLPWINDHTMLGNTPEDGVTPAEFVGVQGVLGEEVCFENDTLYVNLKVFSKTLTELIDAGKTELSAGYRCGYEYAPGNFMGQAYEYVQRGIRGNHLALVEEGRMGPGVAVLDHFKFTIDAKEAIPMVIKKTTDAADTPPADAGAGAGDMTLADAVKLLSELAPQVQKLTECFAALAGGGAPAAAVPGEGEDKGTPPGAAAPAAVAPAAPVAAPKPGEDEGMAAMDAKLKGLTTEVESLRSGAVAVVLKEMGQRDQLANLLKNAVGTFDHAEMTLLDVAKYGVDKLKLVGVPAGHEVTALSGYLAGFKPEVSGVTLSHIGQDSAPAAPNAQVSAYVTDAAK